MAELNKVTRCYRCGVILQTDDPTAEGYISRDIVEKYPDGLLLCNNCFENERFNDTPQEPKFEEEFQTILDTVKKTNGLIVYVIDVFSFEGSFITKLNHSIKDLDVLVVANKRDLMPKNTNDDELINYLWHRTRMVNLKVRDIVLTSTNTGYNIDYMFQKIMNLAGNRDVYFLGASVSGKTSLINQLLKFYKNNTNKLILRVPFKGTNLQALRIPITNKTYIYELPGTDINNSVLSKVERSVQNIISPKKAVEARKIGLFPNSTIALGNLAFIELLGEKKTNINLFASNFIEVKFKRWDSEKYLKYILEKKNIKPVSGNLLRFNDYDVYDFHITEEGSRDIGILGLGWFNFEGNNQTFRIIVPKGVYVYTTRGKVNL
ncbi:MAG: hypothetical protein SOV26_05410 [Candidatus Onthovivens sp.]|nr:hypothetical protein [Candidatus Onthovivens sp.]